MECAAQLAKFFGFIDEFVAQLNSVRELGNWGCIHEGIARNSGISK